MIKAYIDTNVVVARYKPNDPLHEIAEKLFNLPQVELYASPLTLVELYSVLSRVHIETSLIGIKNKVITSTYIFHSKRL